jgi:hypothetical protein
MYWPIGTPRIYAPSTAYAPSNQNIIVSHDGLPASTSTNTPDDAASLASLESTTIKEHNPSEPESEASAQDAAVPPLTPGLPTPATPGVKSVEHDTSDHYFSGSGHCVVPTGEPLIALKVSRTGHLFAVITASTLTIWQTKVRTATALVA